MALGSILTTGGLTDEFFNSSQVKPHAGCHGERTLRRRCHQIGQEGRARRTRRRCEGPGGRRGAPGAQCERPPRSRRSSAGTRILRPRGIPNGILLCMISALIVRNIRDASGRRYSHAYEYATRLVDYSRRGREAENLISTTNYLHLSRYRIANVKCETTRRAICR
ncbi:hypothetical protein EVAR_54627_1 [Eumeta japonica]|uniref:Uncharacterized protein n=1 Tax=Eumeta variegata TaxID=151549 RepID=A0A4C1X7P9_EUMVA|nr:hypothetical protein EVAR_54627_1 [Eumeta japonica]